MVRQIKQEKREECTTSKRCERIVNVIKTSYHFANSSFQKISVMSEPVQRYIEHLHLSALNSPQKQTINFLHSTQSWIHFLAPLLGSIAILQRNVKGKALPVAADCYAPYNHMITFQELGNCLTFMTCYSKLWSYECNVQLFCWFLGFLPVLSKKHHSGIWI